VDRRRDVNEAFAREAFALSVGDVSPPFATPFGVHIVTVTAVEPGTGTLEQVRPQAERLAAQHAIRELLAELRKTTPITYHR
jgi:parvulin-like peptidyl-prolyl isomerase